MPPSSSPSVGVLIAAYNAETSIERAVRSALAEPEVTEVWVIDDHSGDQTVCRAQQADDGSGRLKILRQQVNAGPAAARNLALRMSQATWVCVLDSDDFFLKGRIQRLLSHAPDFEMVADDLLRIDEGEDDPAMPPMIDVVGDHRISLCEFIQGNISLPGQHRQELGFIKPLMKREFMSSHGIVYDPQLRLGEDYHLYARILAVGGRLRLVPPQGYVAVTRASSLSATHTIRDLQALRDCDHDLFRMVQHDRQALKALHRHYCGIDQRLQWRRLIEAVKRRKFAMAISTITSPRVGVFLAEQLLEQAWLRAVGRRQGPPDSASVFQQIQR